MKRILPALLGAVLTLHPSSLLRADETAPCSCEGSFTVSGDIQHFKPKAEAKVENSTAGDIYGEEVFGNKFTAIFAGLPEGQYTLEIFLAETYHTRPGQRVLTISTGATSLAEDLDLFKSAGFAKEFIVTGTVDHKADQILGPLTIEFKAKAGNAKFNAIRIKDSKGSVAAFAKARELIPLEDLKASKIPEVKEPAIYLDSKQPLEKRVADLIRRMSLKEKVSQMMNAAPPIERLKVPGYDYWNECLHGVARAGKATVFPQAIALAAAWDPAELKQVAEVIAIEARAKNNEAREADPTTARYFGLTFWTPNINIFRDPRWGRGHETYGEDPFLTSRMGVAFIQGLQGNDPKYIKAMACAKHYAVHSGPEKLRHTFNATPSSRDLWETYLPQFEAAVREGKVQNIMSAYNAIYGVPAPANTFLLQEVLRKKWGFEGHVVSDCAGISDVHATHRYVKTPQEGTAITVKAGNDLECGRTNAALVKAINDKLITEADLDVALQRVFKARFQLGLFDSPEDCAFLRIPKTEYDTPAHSELALKTARDSMVLLKNDKVLPLDKTKIKRIALIGPTATSLPALVGNYHGDPSKPVNLRDGLTAECGSQIEVNYAPGCPIAAKLGETIPTDNPQYQQALKAAESADVIIFAGGLTAQLEGEEMRTVFEGFDRGDRVKIELPPVQTELLKLLKKTGKPVILVNFSGSSIAMPWEAENLPAILQAWYPGQNGGTAIADILFGKYNPAGRLPVTFYRSTEDLPSFEDYNMANRTYRYFAGKVLYPFGHGLSYTQFEYGKPTASSVKVGKDGKVKITLPVKNTGGRDGEEVVQVYVKHLSSKVPQPIHSLAAFKRVAIKKGATGKVELEVPASALRYWDEAKNDYVVPAGKFEIQIGASSGDIRNRVEASIVR